MNYIHFLHKMPIAKLDKTTGLFSHSCCCPLVGNYVQKQMRGIVRQYPRTPYRDDAISYPINCKYIFSLHYCFWFMFQWCSARLTRIPYLLWSDDSRQKKLFSNIWLHTSCVILSFLLQWDSILWISVLQATNCVNCYLRSNTFSQTHECTGFRISRLYCF